MISILPSPHARTAAGVEQRRASASSVPSSVSRQTVSMIGEMTIMIISDDAKQSTWYPSTWPGYLDT